MLTQDTYTLSKPKTSLRHSLTLSIALIVMMTLVMGATSYLTSKRTLSSIRNLQDNELSLSINMSLISSSTTRMIVDAYHEMQAETQEEVEEHDKKIHVELKEINKILTSIEVSSPDDAVYQNSVKRMLIVHKGLSDEIKNLKEIKLKELQQKKKIQESVAMTKKLQADFINFIAPIGDDIFFSSITMAEDHKRKDELSENIEILTSVLQLEAKGNYYFGQLDALASLEDSADIVPFEERLIASAYQVQTYYKSYLDSPNYSSNATELVKFDIERLIAHGQNLFELKREGMIISKNLLDNIHTIQSLSGLLEKEEADLIAEVSKKIESGIYGVSSDLKIVEKTVAVISILCVLTALFVAWHFIHRLLVLRMVRLNNQMLDIASGNLDVDLQENRQDEIGQMAAAVDYFRDSLRHNIELNKELEISLREMDLAKKEAVEANSAKSDFLANMSHELRTPMNSIIGMSKLLKNERDLNNDQNEMVDIIQMSAHNLLNIVNDILDLSKIEAKSVILEEIPFDLKMVVTNVVNSLLPIASERGLTLRKECDFANIQFLLGDPTRFSRVMTNLIGNAIKYTEEGSVIVQLDTFVHENNMAVVHLAVIDTGIGIPENKLSVIFEKFSQADASTTRKYGGTGLGLAITKHLVELMGGEISVESEVGRGSTFTVTIPFEMTDLSPSINQSADIENHHDIFSPVQRVSSSEARILVAEDYPLNQAFISRLLKQIGIQQFTVVENGQQAIHELSLNAYDVILMDCHMPVINGYDATLEIREMERRKGQPHTPIIAMTANAMVGDKERCIECGMDEYISKPVDFDLFKKIVSKWIDFDENNAPQAITKESESTDKGLYDLSYIRDVADGDQSIEKEFIALYITQSDQNMKLLEEACVDGLSNNWSEAAHILKGGAGSMGALGLSDLLAKAQDMNVATLQEREEILSKIKMIYSDLKSALEKEMS